MTMQITVKLSEAGFTKVKTPFVKLDPGGWSKPKKVYVKTTPTGWSEVWPGIYYYTHTGTGYNMSMHAAFGYPSSPATYIFTNNGNILSDNTAFAALVSGSFPAGSKVILVNNGVIGGKGGFGAVMDANHSSSAATAGGPALDANVVLELQNNGLVAGGGGGGGAGSSVAMKSDGDNDNWVNGGSGGNGQGPSAATAGQYGLRLSNQTTSPNPPEDPPIPIDDGVMVGASGAGGEGGTWGVAGRVGYPHWSFGDQGSVAATAGGSAGPSIRGSGNVSYAPYGDIRGPLQ